MSVAITPDLRQPAFGTQGRGGPQRLLAAVPAVDSTRKETEARDA
jgi:hypothetical protein